MAAAQVGGEESGEARRMTQSLQALLLLHHRDQLPAQTLHPYLCVFMQADPMLAGHFLYR